MAENKTDAEKVEEFATLQFTDNEIAMIMSMSLQTLRDTHAQDIDRGRLLAEAEVRKSVLQLAKQGSTPAQKQFMDMNRVAKRSGESRKHPKT